MNDIPYCPSPDPAPRAPSFEVARQACDCHVHLFGPQSAFPYQANRSYTPHDATIADLRRMHGVLGIERAVIIQASVHGTDNRAVLAGVASDPMRLRGIAAVGEAVSDRELRDLHDGGVRGIRVNLVDKGGMPFSSLGAFVQMADRIRDMGWHIELLVHVEEDAELRSLVRRLSVPVSVGHVGYTKAVKGIRDPGYQEFLALLRDGLCWVKLTGPYRISARDAFPYDDVVDFVHAVVEAAPDRTVWGSDWPHVIHYRQMPNDGDLFDSLLTWVPDAAIRQRILVDNPAKLYGFS
jgi:2-pyrone-4,6-dicarboxylate lactonase